MINSSSKILVTGADGFIGSHLVERLLAKGHRVKALAVYNSQGSYGWLDSSNARTNPNLEIVLGDVRDPMGMINVVSGCDIILHLAALIAIPYSYHFAQSYIDTNVTGTLNILNAAKIHDVSRIVLTSTSETYGSAQYIPMDERHPLNAQSPYAATKIAADQLGLSFYRSFGTPVTILRPFNTFGPRQSARAFIPTIISQLLMIKRGELPPVLKLGSLTPERDLTFVHDTADGFIAAATSEGCLGEVINLGHSKSISVGAVARKLMEIIGVSAEIESDRARIRPELSEVDRLCATNIKAKTTLNWEPHVSLDEGLKITTGWFSSPENLALYKADKYNI